MNLERWHALTPEEKAAHRENVEQRRETAWEMYIAGKTKSEIARATGVSVAMVSIDLEAANLKIQETALTQLQAQRAEQLSQIDHLMKQYMPKAAAYDVEAFRATLALMVRKSRLLGLDAPTKFQHEIHKVRPKKQLSQQELDERLTSLYRRIKARGAPMTPALEAWGRDRGLDRHDLTPDLVIDVTPEPKERS